MAEPAFERLHASKPRARPKPHLESLAADGADVEHSLEGALDVDAVELATRAPDPGDPLAPALRADLERRFNRDLSAVRVHSGSRATSAVTAANATALTRGAHIFLSSPQQAKNVRLLAHELTHVVQQGAAPPLRLAAAAGPGRGVATPVPRAAHAPAAATPGRAPAVQREEGLAERLGRGVVSTVRRGAGAVVDTVGDAVALGRDGIIALARRIAPDLVAMFAEGGIQRFLRGLIASGVTALINRVLIPMRAALSFDNLSGRFGAASTALSEARATLERQVCEGVLAAARRVSAFFSQTFGPVVEWFRGMARSISETFNGLWNSFGAPVVDLLRQAGGAVWESLQAQVRVVLRLISRARSALGSAWDTVKGWLGIQAEEGASEGGGLWNWVRTKASEVGGAIADTVRPILGPLRVAAGVLALIVPGGQLAAVILLWPQIRQAFDWLSEQWQNLNLIPRARQFWTTVLLPRLMDGAERIGSALVGALDWLVGLVGRIGNALAGAIAVRLTGMLEPLNRLVEFARETFNGVIHWTRERLRAAGRDMRGVLRRLISVGRTILDGLLTLISIVSNPFGIAGFLLGSLWRILLDCLKGPFIEFILELLIRFVSAIPGSPLLGLLWPFVRAAVLGFLLRVQRFETARKVAVSNTLARIVSGFSPRFFLGFLQGMAIGLFELVAGPFQALVYLFELPTMFQNFLANLGLRLCDIVEQIRCFAAQLAGRALGRLDDVLRVFSNLLRNPARIVELISCAIQGAMSMVERVGATLAVRLMSILEGPEEAMGEMLGRVTATVVGNALLTYFTAGIGTAAGVVGRIAATLQRVGRALGDALRVLGGLLRQLLGFIGSLARRFASAVASGARSVFGRFRGFFARVTAWLERLWQRIARRFGRNPARSAEDLALWTEFKLQLRSLAARHAANGVSRTQLSGELLRLRVGPFARIVRFARVGWLARFTSPHWVIRAKRRGFFYFLLPAFKVDVLQNSLVRWSRGARRVRFALRRVRPADSNQGRLNEILVRPRQRWVYHQLNARHDASGLRFIINGGMSPTGPVTSIDDIKDLHTGAVGDPIPIHWYKAPSDYPQSIRIKTSTAGTARTNVPMIGNTAVDDGGTAHHISVPATHRVSVGQTLMRQTTPRGLGAPRFAATLGRLGYDWSGMDADHVTDLAFLGFDSYNNLWPLVRGVNQRASTLGHWYSTYRIRYADTSIAHAPTAVERHIGSRRLWGKHFRIIGMTYPPAPNPGGRQP